MMAKEDIEKPKGKKGGMVLIIGIPKPKKGEVKKAARYGRQGGEGGERNRDIKDFQRLMNGDALRRHLTGKRKMTDEQADAVEQEYARAMGAEDFEEAQRMFRENPEKRVPPSGFKPREVNDKYAEMAFSERRERVGKEKRFKGMLNPKLFKPEGLMGRDGITREDMLAYQKTGLYDPNDPDAMRNARRWILNNRDVEPPTRDGERGEPVSEYAMYDDDDFGRDDDEEDLRYPSADRLRQEAEMMGRLLTARGASDRTIEDAMQAIMEGRKPTAQEIGEDEDPAPMRGGGTAHPYYGGGLEVDDDFRPGESEGRYTLGDFEEMARLVEQGKPLDKDEKEEQSKLKALYDLFSHYGLEVISESGDKEERNEEFKEKYGRPMYADPDDLARQGFYRDDDQKIPHELGDVYHDDIVTPKKGQPDHGLARLIRDSMEAVRMMERDDIPSSPRFAAQPGAGRPMRETGVPDEEPERNVDFGNPRHNPRQRAETTLQNIRYAGGAEVDPDPLPGQRTAGGARVTSRGGGQTTMARPRRNVEQEFDQPIDAAMQRFLSPQEEDAELRARGQDIFTSFDDPRDVMSTAFSLLKGE